MGRMRDFRVGQLFVYNSNLDVIQQYYYPGLLLSVCPQLLILPLLRVQKDLCKRTKTQVKESSVALHNFSVIPINSPPSDIQVSPNSELIAVYFKDKNITQVFTIKGAVVAKIEDTQAGISGILWAPDSLQLLVFS